MRSGRATRARNPNPASRISGDKPMISVEAVIVHYGPLDHTLAAIDALATTSGDVELGLTVVDNGGSREVSRCIEARLQDHGAAFPRGAQTAVSGTNEGYAGGLSVGIDHAASRSPRPRHFLLLNNDVTVATDTIDLLVASVDGASDIGIVGPAVLFSEQDEDLVWNAGSDVEWPAARPRSRYHGSPSEDLPTFAYDVGYVAGCAMLLPSSTLERISPLPQEYFLYFEDADIGERVRRAGLRSVVVPTARVSHQPGSSVSAVPELARYYQVRNRILFSARWGGARISVLIARYWFASRKLLKGGSERQAAWDGLRGRWGRASSTSAQ